MKIAITSSGKELQSAIDARFGRCAFFVVVDTDSMQIEAFPNDNKELTSGAGIQAATFVASKGVGAVITGNCGPNAIQVLTTAGIDLYTGEDGNTVHQAVERFKNGSLSSAPKATATATPRQQGMPPGSGRGMGGCGGGRGMGGGRKGSGRGRGMGGCGRGMGRGGMA